MLTNAEKRDGKLNTEDFTEASYCNCHLCVCVCVCAHVLGLEMSGQMGNE